MTPQKPSTNTTSPSGVGFEPYRTERPVFARLDQPLRALFRLITADRLAVLLSLLGMLASYLVAERVFERMPHIEDEVAYIWQARAIAHGQMTVHTPPHPTSYLVPFVVDLNGQRFGKYPPGWPALLAVAVKLGMRAWLNPLLAGLGVWLTYRLGKRFFSQAVGLLAAGLTVSSPFFLMNSGSLLSHPLGMVLTAAFALAWLELFDPVVRATYASPLRWILLAGGCLGMLVLTRPFTALAVAIPFGLHGLYLLARGIRSVPTTDRSGPTIDRATLPTDRTSARRVLAVGLIALAFVGLYLGWQKVVTGDWFKNPYVLWWPYDKIGFGKGYGILERGHNWGQAAYNTRLSLISGAYDLFGWGALSWIFIPYGWWAVTFGEKMQIREKLAARIRAIHGPRNRQAWLLLGMTTSLVIFYMAYWIGSELYGPRYYYEGLFSLTLLSGAGIAFLAGWRVNPGVDEEEGLPLQRFQAPAVMLVVVGLVGYNLAVYLPGRLREMHGLYGANRGIIRDFLNARIFPQEGEQTGEEGLGNAAGLPLLVIVHSETWHFYGALLELEDPFLTTPYIFAWSVQPTVDAILSNDFPARTVYHYYEDNPGILYRRPRKNKINVVSSQ